jgi:hypothetical protein
MTSQIRQLKMISLEFRDLASSVLRSDGEHARPNIRRLLAFVAKTPPLATEMKRSIPPKQNALKTLLVVREQGERLPVPDDPLEELGLLHAALEGLAGTESAFWKECYGYGGKTGVKDCISEVLHDVAGRYTKHLGRVLEMALLDSSDPAYESRRIDVRVGNHSQVNVAQDSATINANQRIRKKAASIKKVAEALRKAGEAEGDAEVQELAEVVAEEVQKAKPRAFTLQGVVDKLKLIAAAGTAGREVARHAQSLLPYLEELITVIRP